MKHLPGAALCLIEDEPIMGESLCHRFSLESLDCHWYRDGCSALDAIGKERYVLIISDIRLPDLNGEELFRTLLESELSAPPTLFITGYGSVDQAVRLLKMGAQDYITKPFELDQLLKKIRAVCPGLFMEGGGPHREPILGISQRMRHIEDMLARVGKHRSTVLVTGESGVGKEHAALYLHRHSELSGSRPFLAVNCAALQESLLEVELFGYEKGAFTGAMRAHRGVFERADGGTLFLDEVSEMSANMQAKLLRAIEDRTFVHLGGEETLKVDVRLVCATNRNLKEMVAGGEFREDLFYRINVIHVHIPPLRERTEDILWFARRFLEDYACEHGVRHFLAPAGERYLLDQPWPGNVRELKHTIERALIFAEHRVLRPAELRVPGAEAVDYQEPHEAGLRSLSGKMGMGPYPGNLGSPSLANQRNRSRARYQP